MCEIEKRIEKLKSIAYGIHSKTIFCIPKFIKKNFIYIDFVEYEIIFIFNKTNMTLFLQIYSNILGISRNLGLWRTHTLKYTWLK